MNDQDKQSALAAILQQGKSTPPPPTSQTPVESDVMIVRLASGERIELGEPKSGNRPFQF